MASVLRIVDLNGRTINIMKGKTQNWAEVVQKANLPSRFEFCLRHWMSDDPLDTRTEEYIKDYLDRVGYILIQDKPDGKVLTDYKNLRDRIAMVPVSSVNQLENLFYSHAEDNDMPVRGVDRDNPSDMTKTEKKIHAALTMPRHAPKQITKLQQKRKHIDEMRAAHPNAVVSYVTVNTDNEFEYNGARRRINGLKQYAPKNVGGDLLYDMDQVVCVEDDGGVFFYDQNFEDITGSVV